MRGQHGQVTEVGIHGTFPGVRILIRRAETMILEPGLRGPALSIPEEKPEQCHIPQAISENTDRLATLGDLNFIL